MRLGRFVSYVVSALAVLSVAFLVPGCPKEEPAKKAVKAPTGAAKKAGAKKETKAPAAKVTKAPAKPSTAPAPKK
jgi:hypothetical protein